MKGGGTVASVKLIPEDEATGRVKEIYDDIMATLEVSFVPNLYKAMAPNPGYLEANWNKVKEVMVKQGKLDRMTKEIIALSVSAVMGCGY
jgi:alkylhydroperoxidase/carboxymuconolactone decarboxylase family protein YurZ